MSDQQDEASRLMAEIARIEAELAARQKLEDEIAAMEAAIAAAQAQAGAGPSNNNNTQNGSTITTTKEQQQLDAYYGSSHQHHDAPSQVQKKAQQEMQRQVQQHQMAQQQAKAHRQQQQAYERARREREHTETSAAVSDNDYTDPDFSEADLVSDGGGEVGAGETDPVSPATSYGAASPPLTSLRASQSMPVHLHSPSRMSHNTDYTDGDYSQHSLSGTSSHHHHQQQHHKGPIKRVVRMAKQQKRASKSNLGASLRDAGFLTRGLSDNKLIVRGLSDNNTLVNGNAGPAPTSTDGGAGGHLKPGEAKEGGGPQLIEDELLAQIARQRRDQELDQMELAIGRHRRMNVEFRASVIPEAAPKLHELRKQISSRDSFRAREQPIQQQQQPAAAALSEEEIQRHKLEAEIRAMEEEIAAAAASSSTTAAVAKPQQRNQNQSLHQLSAEEALAAEIRAMEEAIAQAQAETAATQAEQSKPAAAAAASSSLSAEEALAAEIRAMEEAIANAQAEAAAKQAQSSAPGPSDSSATASEARPGPPPMMPKLNLMDSIKQSALAREQRTGEKPAEVYSEVPAPRGASTATSESGIPPAGGGGGGGPKFNLMDSIKQSAQARGQRLEETGGELQVTEPSAPPPPPMVNPMTSLMASIKKTAQEREERLEETGGEHIMREHVPEVAAKQQTTPQLAFSMAEMVAKSARDREDRMDRGEEKKMRVHVPKEELIVQAKSIFVEAAELGRLTRLNEYTVEAVAQEKTPTQEWKSSGLMAIKWRHDHMAVIHQAAAFGAATKLPEKVVSNWVEPDDDFYSEYDTKKEEMTPHELQLMKLNQKAGAGQQKVDKLVMGRKEKAVSKGLVKPMCMYEQIDELILPKKELPKIDPHKAKKKFIQQTEEDHAPHPLADISNEAATRAWERRARLDRPNMLPKITEACKCPYCISPSPYQTFAYKLLRNGDLNLDDTAPEHHLMSDRERQAKLKRMAERQRRLEENPYADPDEDQYYAEEEEYAGIAARRAAFGNQASKEDIEKSSTHQQQQRDKKTRVARQPQHFVPPTPKDENSGDMANSGHSSDAAGIKQRTKKVSRPKADAAADAPPPPSPPPPPPPEPEPVKVVPQQQQQQQHPEAAHEPGKGGCGCIVM